MRRRAGPYWRTGGGKTCALRKCRPPPGERAPILRRYLAVAPGARPHVPIDPTAPLTDFARVAGRFPVFHISEG